MEKVLLLKAEIREKVGKHATAALRQLGKVPGTIYGHKQEPVSVVLDLHDMAEGLHHGHRVADLQINGKKETIMFKALQYDHLGKDIIHVDLMRVNVSETVKVVVPITLKGIAEGTKQGGVVNEHVSSLEVSCKVTSIPDSIPLVIKDIKVGDTIFAGDIKLPAGMALVSDPKMLVLSCSLVAAAKTEEELVAEEPVQPEVIGEKKREEEAEEK